MFALFRTWSRSKQLATYSTYAQSMSVLKPYLDADERLSNCEELRTCYKRRGLSDNLKDVNPLWAQFKKLEDVKKQLMQSRLSTKTEIQNTSDSGGEHLKIAGKILREDLRNLKISLHALEELLFPLVLNFPNVLHPRTPDVPVTLFSSDLPSISCDHHVVIGRELNILEYLSPVTYFLLNGGALLEIDLMSYFKERIQSDGFISFSNPDFVRSLVLDGSGDVNHTFTLPLEGSSEDVDVSYLIGGASLLSSLCYFIKSDTTLGSYPIKYLSLGKHYNSQSASDSEGLFSVHQNSAVQLLVCTNSEMADAEFDASVELVTNIYRSLNVPFKVSLAPAANLFSAESLRVDFEVYSPHMQRFFPCGHLSLYGDHLSKKLNICRLLDGERSYMHLISGTVVKVPSLIASVIECSRGVEVPIKI